MARAWGLAEEEGFCEENPSQAIRFHRIRAVARPALQCRYALILSSLNSLAMNFPPELIATLVEKQV
ncbi:MAG: hypothetical protein GDA44_10110 [Prochloron sp. SP5CPC1]|nr:hypothetical protein [Candidatus Paraprochloron terpiosi SP5CPC1]